MCGTCVPMFDHHCLWLNQCVGELNYRYFLLYLLANAVYFIYGAVGSYLTILSEIYDRKLFDAMFIDRSTGQEFKADTYLVLNYTLNHRLPLVIVCLLAGVMGLALLAFFCYHLSLIARGLTTYETYKWSHLLELHRDWARAHDRFLASAPPDPSSSATTGDSPAEDTPYDASDDPGPPPRNVYNRGFLTNLR